ncbi:MAG TPA: DUF5990 family protein [Roseiflexaceae bacterium]|nr:DUF5990 family protein [Roseiflexaceae bacterium]HMP41472.1 DUF5990 family protein [Roseiflexaceae bacterium]
MELTINVLCEELPDSPPDPKHTLYLGIQRGEEVIEAVAVAQAQIVFAPSFRVAPLPGDATNFLGPFAKGTPTQRFFYLSWAIGDPAGNLNKIGRTKIHLSQLRWADVERAIEAGRAPGVRLALRDRTGRPTFGSITGSRVAWQI